MAQAIPFTITHEKLLTHCADKLDRHTLTLDQHSKILERNSKAIAQNTKAIAQNTKAIAQNAKVLQEHGIEIRRLGVLLEARESKIDTILEILTHVNKRFLQQDEMNETLENHEHRISAVELTIKRHHKGASRT